MATKMRRKNTIKLLVINGYAVYRRSGAIKRHDN